MHRMIQCVGFIVACTAWTWLHAEDGVVAEGELGAKLREFVQQAHERAGFTGNVLAARDGRVVAAVSFGQTNGPDSQPITPTTLFEIASTTKAITAVAVFRLQEAGKLKLDDPIDRYLPGVPENCRAITIRHLLQHTSGIPNTNHPDWHDNFDAELSKMLIGGPRHQPGTVGQYWNGGYGILSEIVARASGRSFHEYCREALFEPCEMSVSRFTGDDPPKGVLVVTGTSTGEPARTALEHPYPFWKYRGMGGMVTTVWDLWRLDRALAGRRLLNEESIRDMTSNPINSYAPGWEIKTAADGQTYHRHSGSVRGFLSMFCRYPHIDGCLIIQCNQFSLEHKSLLFEMTKGCEQLLVERPLEVTFPEPLPGELAKQLSGRFRNAQFGEFTIRPNGTGRIDWKQGQQTLGKIQINEAMHVVFIDHTSLPIQLKLLKNDTGEVAEITLLQAVFQRVPQPQPMRDAEP